MYHVCWEHLRTEPMSPCSWRHRSRFPTVCCWDANHGSSGHITTPCEAGGATTTGAICGNWWCAALTASIFSLWRSSSRFFICFRSFARLFWNHIFTCNSKQMSSLEFFKLDTNQFVVILQENYNNNNLFRLFCCVVMEPNDTLYAPYPLLATDRLYNAKTTRRVKLIGHT